MRYVDPDGRNIDPYALYNTTSEALKVECEVLATDAVVTDPSDFLPHKWIAYLGTAVILGLTALVSYGIYKIQTSASILPAGYIENSDGTVTGPNGKLDSVLDAWNEYSGSIDTSGWGKGTFQNSRRSLLYHFVKHGKEVKAKSPEQYLNKAQAFKQNLKNAKKIPSYDPQTGERNATRYEKNGKFIILDDETNEILSFGKISEYE